MESMIVSRVLQHGGLGLDAGDALQQACTGAGLQLWSYSEAVRLGKQLWGWLVVRSSLGLCASGLGLFSRTMSC